MIAVRLMFVGLGVAGCLVLSGKSAANPSGDSCPMSHVHYAPFPGEQSNLKPLPGIATAPDGSSRRTCSSTPTPPGLGSACWAHASSRSGNHATSTRSSSGQHGCTATSSSSRCTVSGLTLPGRSRQRGTASATTRATFRFRRLAAGALPSPPGRYRAASCSQRPTERLQPDQLGGHSCTLAQPTPLSPDWQRLSTLGDRASPARASRP